MSEMFTEDDVYEALRTAIAEAGTQRAYARQIGIAPEFLSRVVLKKKPVRGKILAALGFERRTVFVPLAPVENT